MTASCRTFRVSGAVAVAAGLLLTGCMKNLPTAPSVPVLTSGVAIYEHADFAGDSALVTADLGDLKDFNGPCPGELRQSGSNVSVGPSNWNDCMSSLKVAPGWRVTIYRDDDFNGESFDATSDLSNLALVRGSCDKGGMNDCITSIRIGRP